ncbi:MAG: Tad domain-containing protein [Silicimonas sp.]|nr:Tad domain-containing protein [Silicimonas sp.]
MSLGSRMNRLRAGYASDERGSFTIFSLFLFIMLLMIAGMAVDMVRLEQQRTGIQNTIDSAVLAASSLTQNLDSEALIRDHLTMAGYDPDDFAITVAEDLIAGNEATSRRITVTSLARSDTIFMDLVGVSSLNAPVGTMASESASNIEISLVLDISSSMGSNSRIQNLKVAAKDFVDTVIDDNSGRVSISIVPYFGGVVVGDEILSRLNADGRTENIPNPPSYPGALSSYPSEHSDSTCVRFDEADYNDRSISPQDSLRRTSNFYYGSFGFNTPGVGDRWCKEDRPSILAHETSAQLLKDYIEALNLGVYTGGHIGMKWGVALLDPAFRPVVTDMVDSGLLAESVRGRPGNYGGVETMKIIVLMTDGDMTRERDLKDEFKNGPSRVWYVDSRTSGFDSALNRSLTAFDGYFVLMPNNGTTQRWYVPGSPHTTSDDQFLPEAAIPLDAVQLDYHELHRRFAENDIADFFFEHSGDSTAYSEHRSAGYSVAEYSEIDNRLWAMCSAASANGDITVYTIGFEAPTGGVEAMRQCASTESHFFDVDGTDISSAFAAIATQINVLRLEM